MSKENDKQTGLKKALPDETLGKVSGGWIEEGLYINGCQLYTDDIFLKYYNEGQNNTCPKYMGKHANNWCWKCLNFSHEGPG